MLALVAACAGPPAKAATPCEGIAQPDGVVRAVPDALSLGLDDGRIVRLSGLDVPQSGEDAARGFLKRTLLGRTVKLRATDEAADRYGRLHAHVFHADVFHLHAFSAGAVAQPHDFVNGKRASRDLEGWVQQAILAQGLARVSARAGGPGCAARLWGVEDKARLAEAGLWDDPIHQVQRADDPAAVLRLRGRLAVVEGQVLSVRESGATVYVNFGRRWSEDFTVTTARRNLGRLGRAGLDLKSLPRQRVRVRGWVEERGGPWIELLHPEQIQRVGN